MITLLLLTTTFAADENVFDKPTLGADAAPLAPTVVQTQKPDADAEAEPLLDVDPDPEAVSHLAKRGFSPKEIKDITEVLGMKIFHRQPLAVVSTASEAAPAVVQATLGDVLMAQGSGDGAAPGDSGTQSRLVADGEGAVAVGLAAVASTSTESRDTHYSFSPWATPVAEGEGAVAVGLAAVASDVPATDGGIPVLGTPNLDNLASEVANGEGFPVEYL